MGSSLLSLTHTAAAILFTATALPLSAWSPGTGNEAATVGFSVDTKSRNDVISFWHCVYMESEGFENTPPSSLNFKNDVQRRVNYYRAMAGLNANINLTSSATVIINTATPSVASPSPTTTKQEAAQAAAEMLSANSSEFIAPNGGVANGTQNPHSPPSSWSSDGAVARNGAFNSNLAVGVYGPAAIDAYISEDAQSAAGSENDEVGHRRLILQTRLQELATGDTTGSGDTSNGGSFDANALYIRGNLLSSPPIQFVPWPNSGYIPEAITPERWSLSYPGADFTSAVVNVTNVTGANLPVTIQSTSANFGDETIIWQFNQSLPTAVITDQVYNISISNIGINGSVINHSYQVIVINPDRLSESTDLIGSSTPPDSGANYFFNPVDHAEEYELDVSTLINATWNEGAENSEINVNPVTIIDNTDIAYELRSSFTSTVGNGNFWDTGTQAFRLAFPRNEIGAFQAFEINRTLIPRADGAIKFRLRRGFIGNATEFAVQSSIDGGATWNDRAVFNGSSSGLVDSAFNSQTINLPNTGTETLVRFVIRQVGLNGVFSFDNPAVSSFEIGVFLDNIEPVNCDTLESLPATTYGASVSSVPLNNTTGGGTLVTDATYTLRLRVRVGCHWFPFGQSLDVTPTPAASLSAYDLWFRGQFAIIGSFSDDYDQDGISNGAERIFGLNPLDSSDASAALTPVISAGNLQLSHPVIPNEMITAEYSTTLLPNSWTPATVNISNGIATASVSVTHSDSCFIRWITNP